jgi:META domain-containing protein
MTVRGRPAARFGFALQPICLQHRVTFMTASLPRLAVLAFLAILTALPASAILTLGPARANEPFPFGNELMLDAAPMRGSKRVPMIEIEDNGSASIDLWCSSLKAQVTVGDAAITIVPGAAQPAQCDPDRQARDADLLAALTQVTGWRWRGEAIEFTGATPLRFRRMTD